MIIDIYCAIFQIFIIFGIGWFARHLNYLREEDLSRWSSLVIDFLLPCLIFFSISKNLDTSRLGTLWPLPILGFGMMAFGALLGFGLKSGLVSLDPNLKKTFHHFCAINNYGFLPLIMIKNLWGEQALAELFLLNFGSTIGYWTIGVAILGESNLKKTLRNIFSPSLFALLLAFSFSLLGVTQKIPPLFFSICHSLGSASVPLILLLIGATLYRIPFGENKRDIVYLTLIRLIFLPTLTLFILKMLPLSKDVFKIAFIVSLMPTAVSSTLLTRKYGGSSTYAASAAVITTLFSMITIPVGFWLFL